MQISRHSAGFILNLKANVFSRWSLLAFIFVVAISPVAPASAQSVSTFNPQLSTASSNGWGKGGKPKPTPTPSPKPDAEIDWANSGSDFNAASNWTQNQVPGTNDVAWFKNSASFLTVNLSSSASISGLYFSGTASSGYDLTSSGGATFTLTATSISTGALAETGDTTANIIRADNTSGTNTIDAALILAPSGGGSTSTIVQASGGTLIINRAISGSGKSLNIAGGGTVNLNASNTYDGTTTLREGTTLVLGHATNTLADTSLVDVIGGTLSLGSNSDTVAGVTLEAGGSITGSGTLTVTSGGSFQIYSGTVSASLAGSGASLVKVGSGGASLTGINTYGGGTLINGGEIRFDNSSALGTGIVTLGSAAFDSMSLTSTTTVSLSNDIVVMNDKTLNPSRTATIGSFAISAAGTNAYTGTITLNGTLNIESSSVNTNPLTFSGVISGSGGLVMNPSGTLSPGAIKLANNNTYSGGTSIAAGTLIVTGGSTSSATASATGTGSVTVTGSGTYLVGGSTTGTTGTILGATNIGSGSHLSPGTSTDGTNTTAILHTGALTLSSGSFFNVNINGTTAGTAYDQVIASDAISLSGSTLSLTIGGSLSLGQKFFILENSSTSVNGVGAFTNGATVSSGGYTFAIDYADNGDGGLVNNDISLTVLTVVPEPSTWIAGSLALLALGYTQRRRFVRLLAHA